MIAIYLPLSIAPALLWSDFSSFPSQMYPTSPSSSPLSFIYFALKLDRFHQTSNPTYSIFSPARTPSLPTKPISAPPQSWSVICFLAARHSSTDRPLCSLRATFICFIFSSSRADCFVPGIHFGVWLLVFIMFEFCTETSFICVHVRSKKTERKRKKKTGVP